MQANRKSGHDEGSITGPGGGETSTSGRPPCGSWRTAAPPATASAWARSPWPRIPTARRSTGMPGTTRGSTWCPAPRGSPSARTSHDAPAGSLAMIPPGAPHTFANPGDEPLVLLNTFTPDLYVQYFRDLRAMIEQGTALTPEATVQVMSRYATEPATSYADDPKYVPTYQVATSFGSPGDRYPARSGPPGAAAARRGQAGTRWPASPPGWPSATPVQVLTPVHPGFGGTPRPGWARFGPQAGRAVPETCSASSADRGHRGGQLGRRLDRRGTRASRAGSGQPGWCCWTRPARRRLANRWRTTSR